MHWSDEAIVLSARKHGENSAIVRLFTQQHGVCGGVFKGAHGKANRGLMQAGNKLNASWNARLAEQLGVIKAELLTPTASMVMQNAQALAALSSACALLETSLPERHPYPRLYEGLDAFLSILSHGQQWQEAYVKLELMLLAESGFGLDLSQCAATGTTENLIYVSPKSGRAVSKDAGAPYMDKMLPLPGFLQAGIRKNRAESAEILEGLHLTGYFLAAWLAEPHGKKLPAARTRLVGMMKEEHGKTDTA